MIEYDVDPILGCSAPAVAAREKSNGRSVSGSATVSAESRRAQEYFWHTPRAYENKPLLRVGVYQDSTDPGDFAANLRRIHSALLKAKAEGVELLLFGELFLSGYAISERETWHRLAMGQDSPQLSQIREWCKEMRIAVCIGYPGRRRRDTQATSAKRPSLYFPCSHRRPFILLCFCLRAADFHSRQSRQSSLRWLQLLSAD